jgi:hypothetical protein
MKIPTFIVNYIYIFFGLVVFYGLLKADYFPFAGLSILGILLSILFFVSKSKKSLESYFWFVVSVFFSFFLVFFSNPLLTFFNILLLTYSLSALISSGYKMSLFQSFSYPIMNLVFICFAKDNNLRLWDKKAKQENQLKREIEWIKLILTSFITFTVFVVVSLILASSNVFFAEIFTKIFEFLSFLNILKFVFLDVLFNLRFYAALVFAYIIKKTVSYLGDNELQENLHKNVYNSYKTTLGFINKHVAFVWPKIATGFLILVFFLTQIQLYLATTGALQGLGISHQEKVREIFLQLLIVTLIVLSLVFVDTSKKVAHKVVGYFLLFEGFFLTLNALKSDYDYVVEFGLGPQRLYGFAAGILALLVIFVTTYNISTRKDSWYLKTVLALICVTFIGINLVNFDRTMYEFNKNKENTSTRPQELSSDSLALDNVYYQLKNKQNKNSDELNRQSIAMDKIEWLQQKESKNQWQSFNFADWNQNQELKDIKITAEERATIAEQLPHPFDGQFNKNESKQTQSSQQQSSQSSQKPKIQEVDPNQTNRMYQSEEEIYGR